MNRRAGGAAGIAFTATGVQDFFRTMPWYRKVFRRGEKRRLAAQILLSRHRFGRIAASDASEEAPQPAGGASSPALAAGRDELLAAAAEALVAADVSGGWKFLQQLDRLMVHDLGPNELEAQFASATSEAESKLGRWRRDAVERLSKRWAPRGAGKRGAAPAPDLALRRRMLEEIMFHLHMTHQNLYHNIDKLRVQLCVVGALVAALVAVVLVLNANAFFAPLAQPAALDLARAIWLAVLSGFAGGTLSVAFQVARADPTQRIPEVTASFIVTLVRPVVGAACALPVLFFVESGLLAVDDASRGWLLLSLCFVAGFGERWFLGVVEFMGAGGRKKPGASE